MVNIDALIVCAVCHGDLPLRSIHRRGSGYCARCGRAYTAAGGVLNMTPLPPPDGAVEARWSVWDRLQQNGLVAYTKAPEFNLSCPRRPDALAFRAFCQMSGRILDVGCGTQSLPSYLPDDAEIVGIDPLPGKAARDFAFVQGIGEYLPFRSGTFAHVVFATSLDHTMDPRRCLGEARRCLTDDGCVSLWLDGQDAKPARTGRWTRTVTIALTGFRSLSRHGWTSKMGMRRTLSYVGSVARMRVPDGAVDYFHFDRLTVATVEAWLAGSGLSIARKEEHPQAQGTFIQARVAS
jgi:SAM-dependent methyltransferase